MGIKEISRWIRDRIFRRPPVHDVPHVDYKQSQLNERTDDLTSASKDLQGELVWIKKRADERGTNPLAELIHAMQRSQEKAGGS